MQLETEFSEFYQLKHFLNLWKMIKRFLTIKDMPFKVEEEELIIWFLIRTCQVIEKYSTVIHLLT